MRRLLFFLTTIVAAQSAVFTAFADDRPAIARLFEAIGPEGGVVTIPPGDYRLDGVTPVKLPSRTTVYAYGARFHLPDELGDKARRVLFAGENLTDFRWFGGHFSGRVFDPSQKENRWAPNANTRAILVTTTATGRTERLLFRDVTAEGTAGAVVTVLGAEKPGSDRLIDSYARQITLENCQFERCGKFMWDYGYLWQILVWPEEYGEAERATAAKYFRHDLVRGPVAMAAGDDRVRLKNEPRLPVTKPRTGAEADRGYETICFFGDELPKNVVRGRRYFVVESEPEYLKVADTAGGAPIRFETAGGPNVRLITDLFQAHLALYAPAGSGPGKGAFDLVGCEQAIVRGGRFSALGDTMHIQKSRNIVFDGNQITGSRMGAFFLAEFCQNAVVTGNTVDGTNGSRVVSVEKSCEDVTIVGNTFRNGGRGSWINQPKNLVLADNLFVDNTTKCERDPRRGRRSFLTGDYERYAEVYFTTYEEGGRYGPVVVRGNIFTSGANASHALTFAPGGRGLLVSDNLFGGPVRTIPRPVGCEDVQLRNNSGAVESPEP